MLLRIVKTDFPPAGLLSAALLTACAGGSGMPISPSPVGVTAERTHVHPVYSVLYSFRTGAGDGFQPYSGLINVNGTLYGTTTLGGANLEGTVFAITTTGAESVLYSFKYGSGDGEEPYAGLLNVSGTLYGTTYLGGTNEVGTVFSIAASGAETVLHSFGTGSGDGWEPYDAGLVNVNGTLFGTTIEAGAHAYGTVFSITTSGTETVLYSFKGGARDGEFPHGGLINVKGTLYGTTYNGGANCSASGLCGGTVFKITTSGKETVLHSFGGSGDGSGPVAGLINVNGTLYGTTSYGGANGYGTVFSITNSGKETVLHSFGGLRDGAYPQAALINVNGTLYGTTIDGGTRRKAKHDQGTIFAITTTGAERVLHTFKGGSGDGADPQAGLINVNGTLYGTTSRAGANSGGTVFSLTP